MSLSQEAKSAIEEEENTLASVLDSLRSQLSFGAQRYRMETARARDLTSQIVNSRRDSEKQMLSSDEAVSHRLSEAKRKEIKSIDRLLDTPYFARVIIEEERNGKLVETEYKLGTAANSDCRIIDWRKAPIAKLYYEYSEGEEFCELIQGREREGIVKTRNKVSIRKGELKKLSCKHGEFVRVKDDWLSSGSGSTAGSNAAETRGLKDILSLITPEQFRMITEDADSAVLIQGIAGSGKTTVALHRLAWLLHEDNSDLKAEDCLVLVLSPTFRSYISSLLPTLDIEGVQVLTFKEWAQFTLQRIYNAETLIGQGLRSKRVPSPPGVARVKRSPAVLQVVQRILARPDTPNTLTPHRLLLLALGETKQILDLDSSQLLDRELVQDCLAFCEETFNSGKIARGDDGLLLCIAQMKGHLLRRRDGSEHAIKHIVADEVQDYSSAELETIIAAVEDTSQLTLVGDTGQQVTEDERFPGWEALRNHKKFEEIAAVYTQLTVSHRSTLPIMRLADHINGHPRTTEGRQGRTPIWFKCRSENEGVRQALRWLTKVLEHFTGTVITVVCRTAEEARHVVTLLTPSFGSAVRLGNEDGFSFGEGIVVTDVRQIKGLEFPNVLIWNPSRRWYPPTRQSRNMLYVAVTRAEDLVCLVTWDAPSALLPNIRSKLVRGYEPDAIDED